MSEETILREWRLARIWLRSNRESQGDPSHTDRANCRSGTSPLEKQGVGTLQRHGLGPASIIFLRSVRRRSFISC